MNILNTIIKTRARRHHRVSYVQSPAIARNPYLIDSHPISSSVEEFHCQTTHPVRMFFLRLSCNLLSRNLNPFLHVPLSEATEKKVAPFPMCQSFKYLKMGSKEFSIFSSQNIQLPQSFLIGLGFQTIYHPGHTLLDIFQLTNMLRKMWSPVEMEINTKRGEGIYSSFYFGVIPFISQRELLNPQ